MSLMQMRKYHNSDDERFAPKGDDGYDDQDYYDEEPEEDEREDSAVVADDKIADLLYEIVSRMGFADADIEWEDWPDHVRYYVEGKDLGALIGRHGSTLEALQYIVGVINSHQQLVEHMIIVDIEGYRERREVNLRRLALRSAEHAAVAYPRASASAWSASRRRSISRTDLARPT